jgi:hypothetical protein
MSGVAKWLEMRKVVTAEFTLTVHTPVAGAQLQSGYNPGVALLSKKPEVNKCLGSETMPEPVMRILSIIVIIAALSVPLTACSSGGGDGDDNNSNWDEMKWDQGNWS